MSPRGVLVFACLLAAVAASEVSQCSGQNFANLTENIEIKPCGKLPCKLIKGNTIRVTMKFQLDKDTEELTKTVKAKLFGAIPVPFVGVDGYSIRENIYTEDNEKAPWPLKANTKYIYKDSVKVLKLYPSLTVRVHWAIFDGEKDVLCFEVPSVIV